METPMYAIAEDHDRIVGSAHFEYNREWGCLAQLFGYRQRVAQELLKCENEKEEKVLRELIDFVNTQIKTVLFL